MEQCQVLGKYIHSYWAITKLPKINTKLAQIYMHG